MVKTRSMTRNQNHDDTLAPSKNRIMTCDLWSDLNQDVLILVMMQLGVVDFLAFSRVCKSWRSLALSNKNKFIVSRPPMTISISTDPNVKEFYLKDFEGSELKTILPHLDYKTCIGVSCGYLILFSEKRKDFWLLNPITRHDLHVPFRDAYPDPHSLRGILVFSPIISRWVFVVFGQYSRNIWFCIVGKQEWNHISTPFYINDLHALKGNVYTIHNDSCLCEVRLYPTPKVTILEIKNSPKGYFDFPVFVSLGENLYVIDRLLDKKIQEINLSKMEWVSCEKTVEEYAIFISKDMLPAGFVGIEWWFDLHSQCGKFYVSAQSGKNKLFFAKMWYFFHDCLNVIFLDQ
ncbi:hypothetical protein Lser_V15G20582 [Lactuca serriola]